jgi:hypothetical protein
MTDKAEIQLIDWNTVGGVVWRTHVPTYDVRWRQWRHWRSKPPVFEAERTVLAFEAARYPWAKEAA